MKLIFAWVTLVVTLLLFVTLLWPASGVALAIIAFAVGFVWSIITLQDYYLYGIGRKESKS